MGLFSDPYYIPIYKKDFIGLHLFAKFILPKGVKPKPEDQKAAKEFKFQYVLCKEHEQTRGKNRCKYCEGKLNGL